MQAILDIPDSIYGELEAFSAKEGKTLPALAVSLLKNWLAGKSGTVSAHVSRGKPGWAGLCEADMTRNAAGPHDMESIRRSIAEAAPGRES